MILFHPDPEPTGGEPEPEQKPAPASPEALAEMAKLQGQLLEEKQAREQAERLQGEVQTLFNPNATDEARQQALDSVLQGGGLSEADAAALIQELGTASDQVEPDFMQEPGVEQNQPSPEAIKLAELEAKMAGIESERATAAKDSSKKALQTAVADIWDKSPDAKAIDERLRSIKGDDLADKTSASLRKDILREALENLYNRKAQVGTFNPDWIPEEVEKAAAVTLEKAKALGVTDQVGKAPGGLDETVLLSEIANRKIEPPKYDPKLDPAGNTEAAETYTVQRLQQMAAQHAAKEVGGESKA